MSHLAQQPRSTAAAARIEAARLLARDAAAAAACAADLARVAAADSAVQWALPTADRSVPAPRNLTGRSTVKLRLR